MKLFKIFLIAVMVLVISCDKEEIINAYVSADTYPIGGWESQDAYFKVNDSGNIDIIFGNDKKLTILDETLFVRNLPLQLDTLFFKSRLDIDFNYQENRTSYLYILGFDTIEGEYELIGENRQNWIVLNKISDEAIEGSFQFLLGLNLANPSRVFPDTIKLTNGFLLLH